MAKIHIANFSDRDQFRGGINGRGAHSRFILAFGSVYVMVFAKHLENAVETAAECLLEVAPGHIMVDGSEDCLKLVREACEAAGLEWPIPADFDWDDDGYFDAHDKALQGHIRTESGYINSNECTLVAGPGVTSFFRSRTGGAVMRSLFGVLLFAVGCVRNAAPSLPTVASARDLPGTWCNGGSGLCLRVSDHAAGGLTYSWIRNGIVEEAGWLTGGVEFSPAGGRDLYSASVDWTDNGIVVWIDGGARLDLSLTD